MQKILDDDFDSYSDGDLNGQGNWLGDTDFDVQGVIKYSGTKAVKCSLGGTITNIVNPIKNGEVSCYMKIVDSGSGYKYGRLNLYEGSTLIMYLMLNEPYGYLKLITTTVDSGLSYGTWYKVTVQFRNSDGYVRANLDDGSWTAWVAPVNPWVSVNKVGFYHRQAADIYWDDLKLYDKGNNFLQMF